jgi:hypothetical protein
MPRLSLEVPHALAPDEAVRRLKERFAAARSQYRDHVSTFQEEWKDHTFSFSLHALGMSLSGSVAVQPAKVAVDVNLPLAAMLFKRTVEDRLRREIEGLLASEDAGP